MFKLSKISKLHREGVDPRLIEISDLAIEISVIDFGIPGNGGLRTKEIQNKLFTEGLSKADGYVKLSNHQSGEAIDFYAYIDGGASWKHEHLAMVAAAFLQAASMLGYKLNWGGLWSSSKKTNGIPYGWDMAHCELG
jgi:peptidoglycan L-alanyl-D-glutamate endopeptidase CwlK